MLRRKDVNSLIRQYSGEPDKIGPALLEVAGAFSSLFPYLTEVRNHFDISFLRSRIFDTFKNEDPSQYIKNIGYTQHILENELLQEHLIQIFKENPWVFSIHKDILAPFFSKEFFQNLLESGEDFFHDPSKKHYLKIFQLYYAGSLMMSFDEKTQEKLQSLIERPSSNVSIVGDKDVGFACGGMDKNFYQAACQKEGLCIVNDSFLAKKYHTKGEEKSQKVSLISRYNMETDQHGIVWKDFIYAPSCGQHELISEVIQGKIKEIGIPNLSIKPVRPLLHGFTSENIFKKFES